jgi:hypothetical protein
MRKQQIAIITLAIWLSIVATFMLLEQWLNIELIFVSWLIGILIIVGFMEPNYVQPMYLKYINYLIAIGVFIFGMILVQKVLEILT